MNLQDAWSGAWMLLQSPLALAAALAATLFAQARGRDAAWHALIACAAALSVCFLRRALPVDAITAGALIVLGLAVAAGYRSGHWVSAPMFVAAGWVIGLAGQLQTASWPEAIGAGIVIVMLVGTLGWVQGLATSVRVAKAVTLARRMAGAWIGAVGLLMLALSIQRGGS